MNKINLIIGDNFIDVNKKTLEKIDNKNLDIKNIIIVPDRFSLLCEKQIFETLKTDVVFNVDVMGITRFASMLLEKGNLEIEYISKQESLMLVSTALKNVQDKLHCFSGEITKSICEEFLHTITQLKSNDINSAQLSNFNEEGFVFEKLHDIQIVYEEYNKLLSGRLDSSGIIQKLKENLFNFDLSNYNVFFVNFDSFSEYWYSLIQILIPKINQIFIGAIKAKTNANSYIFEEDIFNKISSLANINNFNLNIETVNNSLNKCQQAIHSNLFSSNIIQIQNNEDFVSVFECQNKTNEIQNIAKIIKQKLVNENIRFNQIQVAVGDLKSYAEEIKKVFKEYGFSFYVDESRNLLELETVKFLISYLKLLSGCFEKTTVEEFLFSPFFDFNEEEKFSIYNNLIQTNGFAKILDNAIFKSGESIYQNIYFEKNKKEKIKNIIEKINKIINKINLFNFNNNFIEFFEKNNNILNQKLYSQIEDKLSKVLSSIEKIIGEEGYLLKDFLDILIYFLEETTLSTVPVGIDTIFVGDATASYFEEKDFLFVLGANQNLIPRYLSDNLILDDDTIKTLENTFRISPSVKIINKRNRFKLFNLLLLAKKQLVVCYSLSDGGKEKLLPSSFVQDLEKIFNSSKSSFEAFFKFSIAKDNPEIQFQKLYEYSGLKNYIESSLSQIGKKQISPDVVASLKNISKNQKNEETFVIQNPKKVLLKNNSISVSQVHNYLSCPLKNFFAYGLKLQENATYQIKPNDIGNYLHAVVEKFLNVKSNFVEKIKNKKEELKKVLNKIFREIENNDNFQKFLVKDNFISLNLLHREAENLCAYLVENISKSNFKPAYLELSINKNNPLFNYKLTAKNQEISFSGRVDRVDVYDDMLRIIDYKTGQISSASPKDIYYGEGVQVFAYAKILEDILKKQACGAYYFPLKNIGDKDKKQFELKGKSVDIKKYLDCADETPGEISEIAFKNMCNYSINLTTKALEEIIDGNIKPNPFKDKCKTCIFTSICENAFTDDVREKLSVPKDFFDREEQ